MNATELVLGLILIGVGILGLVVCVSALNAGYSPSLPMGHMMFRWADGKIEEISGEVEKIEWMEIELTLDGREIEVHGPWWFWQAIGVKNGDEITVVGMIVNMFEPEEGWHQALMPYQLVIGDQTYGNADRRIPVWMQG
ncbi:MAG: hypothetical protein ACPL4E_10430 [Thermoproteota archaeon]